MSHLSSKMDQLGTDFHATGSVMTPSQLKEYRLKRGECVTCGRKCFQKKLFKMSPITEPGKVWKGRCLACHPLSNTTTSNNNRKSNASNTSSHNLTSDDSGSASLRSGSTSTTKAPSQADVARFSQSQRNLSRTLLKDKRSMSARNFSSATLPSAPSVRRLGGRTSSKEGQTPSQGGAHHHQSTTTTASSSSKQSFARKLSRAKSQEDLPIHHNPHNGMSLTRSMSMANVSPRRKKLHTNTTTTTTNPQQQQMKRLSSLSSNSNSHSHSNNHYRHVDSFAEEDEPPDESSSSSRRGDAHLRGSRGKQPPQQASSSRSDGSLRQFFHQSHNSQNRRETHDWETSSRQSALSISRHSQSSRQTDVVVEELFHTSDSENDDDDASDRPDTFPRPRRRSSIGSRASAGEESFTNASETYDEYTSLPKFGVTGEQLQDALQRVNGGRRGREEDYEHGESAGTSSNQSPTPNNRSQRSLLSRNSSNHTSGRQQLSSRSLRSTSGHNTDEELAKFERSRPAHGVLNRGGAVNLIRIANIPQQGEIQSADSRGSLFSGGSAEDTNPQNAVSARHKYYERRSNRSLDSMSSFADHQEHGNEEDEYNVIERQESMNSLLRDARERSYPSLSHHASVSSGSGRALHSSSQHSYGAASYHESQKESSHNSAQYSLGASEHSRNDEPRPGDIRVPGMNHSNSHTSLGELSFSLDGDQDDNEGLIEETAHQSHGSHNISLADEGLDRLNMVGTDIVEIVYVVRDFPDSEHVQTQALQGIANLHLTPDDCDALAEVGGMEAIVDSMERFPDSDQLHLCACRALCNISGTPENQMGLVDIGAADILLNGTMETFADLPELVEQSLAALANLAALADNLEHLIEKEIVSKLVQVMNKHSKDVQVQMKGCSVITNLASHPSPLKSSVMMAGGGGAVVLAMVVHSQDPQLQEKGLQALRNLSANNEDNKLELAHIGGIDSCISAMQVHRDDPFVQEAGAWTLCNLAGHFENKRHIGESGGIDVLIRAIWVHSQQQTVLEWCVRALCAVSVHEDNCPPIMEAGGISAVVTTMQAQDKSPLVQEMGCAALCNLAVDDAAKRRIVDEEALDAIVLAMVLYTEDDKVQERACQALLELAIPEHLTQMQASNVSELAHSAAMKFPDVCQDLAQDLDNLLADFAADYRP